MAGASMDGAQSGRGADSRRHRRLAVARTVRDRVRSVLASASPLSPAVAIVLTLLLTAALAKDDKGVDVHRLDGDCRTCHTADAASLKQDPAAAKAALVADLEARCTPCHSDEGPSHKTGIRPAGTVPATLPLAPDGTIGCATCHFMHGEHNGFGAFLRVDNRHGALCLSCHQLSELQ